MSAGLIALDVVCVFRWNPATGSAAKWATHSGANWTSPSAVNWATDSDPNWTTFSLENGIGGPV